MGLYSLGVYGFLVLVFWIIVFLFLSGDVVIVFFLGMWRGTNELIYVGCLGQDLLYGVGLKFYSR